jgi:hypothetical protein
MQERHKARLCPASPSTESDSTPSPLEGREKDERETSSMEKPEGHEGDHDPIRHHYHDYHADHHAGHDKLTSAEEGG